MQENNPIDVINETTAQAVEQDNIGVEASIPVAGEPVTQEELEAQNPHADFNPVTYLIEALTKAGHPNPTAWTKDLDPRSQTAEKVEDRMFFVNRAIRLYISEHLDMENITPRMILAEGIAVSKWIALMEQGVVKWLMGKFNKKPEVVQEETRAGLAVVTEETVVDSTDTATNVFDENHQLKDVVIAGGIDLPEGVDPKDFPQPHDAPIADSLMDSLPDSITE